ncbi:MAG: hypothetical protein EDM74_11195 [Armatimonadetes bacterium]|nr:MAG: hypothetical protein EDM74_11195 [Armatimonadota bacterium]
MRKVADDSFQYDGFGRTWRSNKWPPCDAGAVWGHLLCEMDKQPRFLWQTATLRDGARIVYESEQSSFK